MFYASIIRDDENDLLGNVPPVAEHDLTMDDVETVLAASARAGHSNSAGYPVVWGHVPDGRFILVVHEEIDEATVRVLTAYEVPEPRAKPKRKKK
jgi:hypothetical protein